MEYTIFGRTGLKASRTAFGCIPIQRITFDESTRLLKHAYDNGVNLFDTATGYTTSEERIGIALHDVRNKIILCTKSFPKFIASSMSVSLGKPILRIDLLIYCWDGITVLPSSSRVFRNQSKWLRK